MKKISTILVLFILSFYSLAQDRIDSDGIKLFYKSQELKKARFWEKGSSGKWESRKNDVLDDGVNIRDNFLSLYFGMTEYEGEQKIVFYRLYWKGQYKYPNIELEWINRKTISAAIISIEQYDNLKNIQPNEIAELITLDTEEQWIGHQAYGESSFLYTLLLFQSTRITLKEKPISETIFLVKRTTSDGKDVVRFNFHNPGKYITGKTEIDNFYFEVPYKEFLKLFTEGKL